MRAPSVARRRGLTLLELMVALAMMAVLGLMAAPPIGSMLARHRVQAAAANLVADLGEARHEAVRRGSSLHVNFQSGSDWCYAIATEPATGCTGGAGAVLKRISARDHPGITLAAPQPFVIDGRADLGPEAAPAARLTSARGDVLQVQLTLLGRAKVCAPEAPVGTTPRC
jgi:type IV fimbrial biogenesis protein FimT